MTCPHCALTATTDRPDRTELGYRRFRCRACKRVFNERTGTLLVLSQSCFFESFGVCKSLNC
jgi:transposase-like protein